MKKIIIVFLAVFAFACRQAQQNDSVQNQTPKQTPSVSPSAIPTASPNQTPSATPNNAEIKRGDSTGIVTKINLEAGSIELDHEEIKGIMLDGLKVGDKVDFTLEENRGQETIIKLAKSSAK
jgi:Cu/Ag efflux protein CusF